MAKVSPRRTRGIFSLAIVACGVGHALGTLLRGRSQYSRQVDVVNTSGQVRAQVFYLFMLYDKIHHQEIWEQFFNGAALGVDYTALVHCKYEAACRKGINSPRFLIIPSVPTSYCMNLVSGMNALLRAAVAIGGVGNRNDKFVFVSDSTLPAKSSGYIHEQLTRDASSDFCLFPRNEWAEVFSDHGRSFNKIERVAPKHHQWIVLNRRHTEICVDRMGEDMDLMQQLRLNNDQFSVGYRNTGCLDEFWHFTTIYQGLDLTRAASKVDLVEFSGSPLDTSSLEIQGNCNTYAQWVQRASGKENNMTIMSQALFLDVGTELDPATNARPGSMRRFGRVGLAAIRRSPFLFVRKVDPAAQFSGCESLQEAWSTLILSKEKRALSSPTSWKGSGVWLDNLKSPVSMHSVDGGITLRGEGVGMQAKGYFCGDRVELTFTSGYRTSGALSKDGKVLTWANGVKWLRLE